MSSTYTTNNGIELIPQGGADGVWGTRTNANLGFIDTSLDGQVSITLTSSHTSGAPFPLNIANAVASDGRNRMVICTDGGDVGASGAYVQLTPNDAEKLIFVRNSLSANRSVFLYQGTYNASNDYELANGDTVLIRFDGGGGSATATPVFDNTKLTKLTVTNINDLTLPTGTETLVGRATTDTLTNKTIDANGTGNSISNLEVADFASGVLDTDLSSVSASDDTLASAKAIKAYVDSNTSSFTPSSTDTLTNKTIDANGTGNSISNLEVADFASGVVDTDISSVSASDDTLASAKAIKTYVDSQVTSGAITADSTSTLTNKTIDANGTGNSITNLEVADFATGVVDTDISTVSASDDTLASAKAIKAYVDSQVTSGAITADSTNTLTNKSISLTNNTISGTTEEFNTALTDGSFATLAGTETLTNKTLTSPAITTATLTTPKINDLSSDHTYNFAGSELVDNRTVTLPLLTGNDTFVFEAHTQTLTNKTIDADSNTLSNIEVDNFKSGVLDTDLSTVSASDDTLASAKAIKAYVDTQGGITASSTTTFTNKTIDANGTGNSISNLEVADFATGVVDIDLTSVSASDDTLASAKAIKAYADSVVPDLSGAVSTIQTSNLAISRALISDANGKVAVSTVTDSELAVLDGLTATTDELNYVDGVTSAIQTQLDSKLDTNGTVATATTATELDATGDINIDSSTGVVNLVKNGTNFGVARTDISGVFEFFNPTNDKPIKFVGRDAGAAVTALALDMAAAGAASFSSGVTVPGTFTLSGGTQDWTVTASGTNLTFAYNGVNKMRLDSNGNLTITGTVTESGTIT